MGGSALVALLVFLLATEGVSAVTLPYLYQNTPLVIELPGRMPEEVDSVASRCPFYVEFYLNWCPHCKRFVPKYLTAAQFVNQSDIPFGIAAVDCDTYKKFCMDRGLRAFPHVMYFPPGSQGNISKATKLSFKTEPAEEVMKNTITKVMQTINLTDEVATACRESFARLRGMLKNTTGPGSPPDSAPSRRKLWLADLLRALHHALTVDAVIGGALRAGTTREVAKRFLKLASVAFPDNRTREYLANKIYPFLARDVEQLPTSEWEGLVSRIRPSGTWLGCRGSKPTFRGYTCGLWQLFHSLAVGSLARENDPELGGRAALDIIVKWIENIFGCLDCRNHFMSMTSSISAEVTTDPQAVMWLWRAHNKVNARLKGDETEDPEAPKEQWPSKDICPNCSVAGSSVFLEPETLVFLRNFYTNVSARDSDVIPIIDEDGGTTQRAKTGSTSEEADGIPSVQLHE
eukprot:Sspe_Gene.76547::Locus_47831_Transcript_1_1_Confidence_1.000_Length_1430::g.76547::m.76547/K10758/QSOX; thiol oxidase